MTSHLYNFRSSPHGKLNITTLLSSADLLSEKLDGRPPSTQWHISVHFNRNQKFQIVKQGLLIRVHLSNIEVAWTLHWTCLLGSVIFHVHSSVHVFTHFSHGPISSASSVASFFLPMRDVLICVCMCVYLAVSPMQYYELGIRFQSSFYCGSWRKALNFDIVLTPWHSTWNRIKARRADVKKSINTHFHIPGACEHKIVNT